MHSAGVNHRDCYICHFMLDPELACYGNIQLHVIDLHRARIRDKVPHRYLVKDLAGILFSSFHIKPTREEWMRFAQIYSKHLPHLSPEVNPSFWNKVTRTAIKLYKKEFKKLPVFE